MPQEVITIVNQSGKIISNGKQLLNIFKEAKAAYQEKKEAIRAERAVRRSETYDLSCGDPRYDYHDPAAARYAAHDDDAVSYASRRSRRSRWHPSSRRRSASQSGGARPALTEGNLRTHSEVSSTTPSRPPLSYRPPQAGADDNNNRTVVARRGLFRSRSTTQNNNKKQKEVDMDLAYGSVPPDLGARADLDPAYHAPEKEATARALMERIEAVLTEAQCLHHTATHIIAHLQVNPEAAAAVALTLAELSALLAKMSPSFLAVIKGGSPAIFALLASPQFLIAAGVAVGVTVVMFGGWKIIQRISEGPQPLALPVPAAQPQQQQQQQQQQGNNRQDYDEALVVDRELSSIESWRRGIWPFSGSNNNSKERADLELISPEADRAIRSSQYGGEADGRTRKSSHKKSSSKHHKSSKSEAERKSSSSSSKKAGGGSEAGTHNKSHKTEKISSSSSSSSKTEKSGKSKHSSSNKVKGSDVKALEDGSKEKDRNAAMDAAVRPGPKRENTNTMMLKALFKPKGDQQQQPAVVA
ncbi:hypothetical protein F4780DRAFT_15547 [Xylariomycetidae sp. FL0641]|nr:hypothetical protein F4780DRAFT_15547 [Xylariomycetidae sp. FL0641]